MDMVTLYDGAEVGEGDVVWGVVPDGRLERLTVAWLRPDATPFAAGPVMVATRLGEFSPRELCATRRAAVKRHREYLMHAIALHGKLADGYRATLAAYDREASALAAAPEPDLGGLDDEA